MLLVDTVKGELVDDDELKIRYASRQPYGEWLDSNLINLRDLKIPNLKVTAEKRDASCKRRSATPMRTL